MKFNINDIVRVRFNDHGFRIYKEKHPAVYNRDGKELFQARNAPIDKEGYTSIPLWELMAIYGEYISIAQKPPFDTEIVLDNNTIK